MPNARFAACALLLVVMVGCEGEDVSRTAALMSDRAVQLERCIIISICMESYELPQGATPEELERSGRLYADDDVCLWLPLTPDRQRLYVGAREGRVVEIAFDGAEVTADGIVLKNMTLKADDFPHFYVQNAPPLSEPVVSSEEFLIPFHGGASPGRSIKVPCEDGDSFWIYGRCVLKAGVYRRASPSAS
jgi:hypothetical protein